MIRKGMRPADGKRKVGCPNWRANIEQGYRCLHLEEGHAPFVEGSPCIWNDCRCGGGPGKVLMLHGKKVLQTLRLLAEVPQTPEVARAAVVMPAYALKEAPVAHSIFDQVAGRPLSVATRLPRRPVRTVRKTR